MPGRHPRFRGVLVQKILPRGGYRGEPLDPRDKRRFHVDEEMAREMIPQTKGIPICKKHDLNKQVGSITASFRNPDTKAWDIEFEVWNNTEKGRKTIQDIRDGKLRGLSLQHLPKSRKPLEATVCMRGMRDGTWIYANVHNSNEGTTTQDDNAPVYLPSTDTSVAASWDTQDKESCFLEFEFSDEQPVCAVFDPDMASSSPPPPAATLANASAATAFAQQAQQLTGELGQGRFLEDDQKDESVSRARAAVVNQSTTSQQQPSDPVASKGPEPAAGGGGEESEARDETPMDSAGGPDEEDVGRDHTEAAKLIDKSNLSHEAKERIKENSAKAALIALQEREKAQAMKAELEEKERKLKELESKTQEMAAQHARALEEVKAKEQATVQKVLRQLVPPGYPHGRPQELGVVEPFAAGDNKPRGAFGASNPHLPPPRSTLGGGLPQQPSPMSRPTPSESFQHKLAMLQKRRMKWQQPVGVQQPIGLAASYELGYAAAQQQLQHHYQPPQQPAASFAESGKMSMQELHDRLQKGEPIPIKASFDQFEEVVHSVKASADAEGGSNRPMVLPGILDASGKFVSGAGTNFSWKNIRQEDRAPAVKAMWSASDFTPEGIRPDHLNHALPEFVSTCLYNRELGDPKERFNKAVMEMRDKLPQSFLHDRRADGRSGLGTSLFASS